MGGRTDEARIWSRGACVVSRVRDWLELARLGNLPTVWTNVTVGAVFAARASQWEGLTASVGAVLAWLAALIGVSLAYASGMIGNATADRGIDALERPTRPIPSGRVSLASARVVCVLCAAIAILVVFPTGWLAAALVGVVLLLSAVYNAVHHRAAWSVVLLGVCRAGAALIGAAAVGGGLNVRTIVYALAIATYTAAFSMTARDEAESDAQAPAGAGWATLGAAALAPLAAIGFGPRLLFVPAACAAAALWAVVGWRLARRNVGAGVSWWIAGFCVIDACVLAAAGAIWIAVGAGLCLVVAMVAQRRLPAT